MSHEFKIYFFNCIIICVKDALPTEALVINMDSVAFLKCKTTGKMKFNLENFRIFIIKLFSE